MICIRLETQKQYPTSLKCYQYTLFSNINTNIFFEHIINQMLLGMVSVSDTQHKHTVSSVHCYFVYCIAH